MTCQTHNESCSFLGFFGKPISAGASDRPRYLGDQSMVTESSSLVDIDHVVFMKVGYHAGETIESIAARKMAEVDRYGFTYWGYGGSVCHPLTQVQPFCRKIDELPWVVFLGTNSDPGLASATMNDVSNDNRNWGSVSPHFVTSSKWGLVIGAMEFKPAEVHLDSYEVAIGPSTGTQLSSYLRGRCDKACASRVAAHTDGKQGQPVPVVAMARLVEPLAVFFR